MDAADFLFDDLAGSDAEVVIGAHDGMGMQHCFRGYEYDEAGEPPSANSITRLLYTNFLPIMGERFVATAPTARCSSGALAGYAAR